MRAWLVAFAVVAVAVSGCVTQGEPGPDPSTTPTATSSTTATATTTSTPTSGPDPGPYPVEADNETTDSTPGTNETPESQPEPGPKPVWGDPETAPIYPGVYAHTGETSCTTNFLFTSSDYRHVYIGTAAHCFAGNDPCDPEGEEPTAPGGEVRFHEEFGTTDVIPVTNATHNIEFHNVTGTLVYNSWYTQRVLLDELDAPPCTSLNDFALIEVPLEAQGLVTPVWRHFGVAATHILEPREIQRGDAVIGYGHSHNWFGLEPVYPKYGVVTGEPYGKPDENGYSDDFWIVSAALAPLGIPGDSGSPLMTPEGGAVGLLQTGGSIQYNNVNEGEGVPATGTNGFVTLSRAITYMETHTDLRVIIAPT